MDKRTVKQEIISWLYAILVGVLITIGLRYFIYTPIIVDGASMMPTISDGDRVIVNKIVPKLSQYDRFDVIVFRATEDSNYIKRIIGIPGDKIEYINDELFINGQKYEETYLDGHKASLMDNGTFTEDFRLEDYLEEEIVPEDCYFVLGDNRRRSIDSRDTSVGFVSVDQIIGSVDLVIWPLNHLAFVKE